MPTIEMEWVGTERRRSERLRTAVVIYVTSLDPELEFSGRCNTTDVSLHGCQFFIARPFKHGAPLRLDIPDTQRTATARVVRSMPVLPDMNVMLWKVGVELDLPGNCWGVERPPRDWK
jgi:hypothetical protein